MIKLYENIFKRKSIRKYIKEELSSEQQSAIMDFAENTVSLYPDIKTRIKIVPSSEIGGLLTVKAPQYLLIYSEKEKGALVNAGFILQQIDLYLSSQGIGSCWLGMGKPKITSFDGLEYVIMLAVGKPAEQIYRESITDFNRKTLPEISQGEDVRLEPARLAPSARNGQPWFFVCTDRSINIYRKKPGGLLNSVFDRLTQIDIGIVMAHLMIAGEKNGIAFTFDDNEDLQAKADYVPVGVV